MILKFVLFALWLHFTFVCCHKSENATAEENEISARKTRATSDFVYADLIGCAVQSDASCLVNVAEDFLSLKKNELLAQADQEVVKATGRSDPNNSPTELSKTIEKLLSDLTGLFKNGISRFFRDSDDDETETSEDGNSTDATEETDTESRDVGESRLLKTKKKKKKKPLKRFFSLIKIGILTGIVFLKVCLLIKIFEAGLKFKLFLVALGSVLIQGFKFYMELRKKNSHDDHIIYKSPYDSGADWSGPGVSDDYQARASNPVYAQNLAYSSQKPT